MSSFIGGIILVLCLQAGGFFAMRFLKSKEQSSYDPMWVCACRCYRAENLARLYQFKYVHVNYVCVTVWSGYVLLQQQPLVARVINSIQGPRRFTLNIPLDCFSIVIAILICPYNVSDFTQRAATMKTRCVKDKQMRVEDSRAVTHQLVTTIIFFSFFWAPVIFGFVPMCLPEGWVCLL